jgi:hypothetical protein
MVRSATNVVLLSVLPPIPYVLDIPLLLSYGKICERCSSFVCVSTYSFYFRYIPLAAILLYVMFYRTSNVVA